MFIATRIHNQSLGRAYLCDTFEEALTKAHSIAVNILDRDLLETELFDLEEYGELFIEADHDNHYNFCIGLIED
jgi:hypothetical protein